MKSNIRQYLISGVMMCMLVALPACQARVVQEGFPPAAELKEKIASATNRQDVLQALGTPSMRNNYGDEIWYYISTEKEYRAFFAPDVVRQDVLKITFNKDGSLQQSEILDKSAGKDVAMYEKITPTEGHKLGFAEQILGNVGRFNNPAGANNNRGPRSQSTSRIPGRM